MRPRLTAAAAGLAALLCAAPALAQAPGGGGVELLRAFLEKTPTAQITLARQALNADGETVAEGTARLLLARPDKFRLEHHAPEELLIVSDGETMWTYEPDLAQAIRRPHQSAAGLGALAILAGDVPEAHFQLSAPPAPDANGLRWVTAAPRPDRAADDDDAAGVDGGSGLTIRAAFAPDGELAELHLRDAFGGVVKLTVRGLTRDPPDDSEFNFNPPPGTDIVAEDG